MKNQGDQSNATLYAAAIMAQKLGFLPALQELHRLEVRSLQQCIGYY
jgi:hypothetical protein